MTVFWMNLRSVALLGLLTSGVAQGVDLSLIGGPSVLCPAGTGLVLVYVVNPTSVPQLIPKDTTLTLVFSLPVAGSLALGGTANTEPPGLVPSGFSGNTATFKFVLSTVMPGDSFWGLTAFLNLQGTASGTPIGVTVMSSPAGAIAFPGSANTTIVGIMDSRACRPAPASTFTSEDLIASCPSAQEISAFNRAVTINLESDPSRGTLVCRAADGSADLTRLQERTYQALRLMQRLPVDAPFPWTSKPLYDWFTSTVRGIRFRGDIGLSFCCDPVGVINIQTNLGVLLPEGVRLALGAGRGHVAWLVIGSSLRYSLVGTVVGLSTSWALARWIKTLLYGVAEHDLVSFSIPPVVLATVGILPGLFPMCRAVRIDPAKSLRER